MCRETSAPSRGPTTLIVTFNDLIIGVGILDGQAWRSRRARRRDLKQGSSRVLSLRRLWSPSAMPTDIASIINRNKIHFKVGMAQRRAERNEWGEQESSARLGSRKFGPAAGHCVEINKRKYGRRSRTNTCSSNLLLLDSNIKEHKLQAGKKGGAQSEAPREHQMNKSLLAK